MSVVATGSEGRERELLQLFSGVPFAENLRLVMNLSVKPGVNQNMFAFLLLLFVCLFVWGAGEGEGGCVCVCVGGGG